MLLLVDELDDARIIQAKSCGVDVLSIGVVAHYEDLGFMRVIDVEGEIIAGHYPVERWGDHTRERDLCRGDLSLELVLCSAFPGVHKGGQVVSELIVGGEDGEDLGVGSVEELDGVGEGTVPASLVDLEEPDDGRQQDISGHRAFHLRSDSTQELRSRLQTGWRHIPFLVASH